MKTKNFWRYSAGRTTGDRVVLSILCLPAVPVYGVLKLLRFYASGTSIHLHVENMVG